MRLPKKIATLLTITLVATNVGNTTFADTIQRVSSENLIGEGRWETAIEVSKKGWTSSDEAIIVNDNSIVDALSATPFAEAKNAPILLTQKDKLDEKTKAELKRLGVKKVYIIGGENTLTKNVETELKSHNIQTDRIQGATRELTSLEIAKRLDKIKPISEIAVVNGTTGLADAVSIAAVAADKDMAIILSNPNEGTKASDEFIKSKNISTSYVIGGENVISIDVENKLPNAKRIAGIDRNETNAKVIETFYTEKEIKNAYVAKDGMGKEDYLIDALSVGVLAAKNDSPVIIVGNKLNQMQKDVTNTKSFDTVTQVGGSGNETAFDDLKTMQGVTVYEVKTVEELNDALAKADANDVINVRSLIDNTKSNDVIEIKSNNAITVNLYDNSKSFVSDMNSGKLVVNTKLSSIDVKSGDLVINNTVGTVNVVKTANVIVAQGAVVNKVEVSKDATGTVIENAGKIENVVSNAPNVSVENNGTVGSVSGTDKPSVDGNPVTSPSTGGGSSGGVVQNPTVSDINITTNYNDITVTATAKNYTSSSKAKVELIGEDSVDAIEVAIGEGGSISHTFKEVDNGTYTVKVTVDSASSSEICIVDVKNPTIGNMEAIYYDKQQVEFWFEIDEDIDLSKDSKANIIVNAYDQDNNLIVSKNKSWAGYLNDKDGSKYGQGFLGNNKYLNTVPANTQIGTKMNLKKDISELGQIKLEVEITNNAGKTSTEYINYGELKEVEFID